ncbi:palladin [Festucalex cinctus]
MAHVRGVQKKSSSLSLTISSSSSSTRGLSSSSSSSSSSTRIASRHSSLAQQQQQQPCVSPPRTESRIYDEHSGSGVAATFVKCLHDVCALKGQLVVLECRLSGTPPPQVTWYREAQQILDCDDFRILRKKASSASVPEELCTLVITEAFPEDSGVFKCVARNSFGTVSCSAMLDVYDDLEEQLEMEAIRQQGAECLMESNEAEFQLESAPLHNCGDFPAVLPDTVIVPLRDWPSSSLEDVASEEGFQEPLLVKHSSEDHFKHSSEVHRSPEVPVSSPAPAQDKQKAPTAKLFTPIKLAFNPSPSGGNTMNLPDLPTFKPGAFPPSAFNYARPRHFIQSQSAFQAPSYESVMREAQENQENSKQTSSVAQVETKMTSSHRQPLAKSLSQTRSQLESLSLSRDPTQPNGGTGKSSSSSPSSSGLSSPVSTSSAAAPSSSSSAPSRVTMRSSITVTPSASGLGSATLPANQDAMSAPAAYLCSVLPSRSSSSAYSKVSPSSAPRSPTSPLTPQLPVKEAATSSAAQQPPPSSPPFPRSDLSPAAAAASSPPQPNAPVGRDGGEPPAVVSMPANYKGTPSTLPRPVVKKAVTSRPSSSRSTDEEIQGSKDALIQDLEKKLRSKEVRRRSSQKLSYEERMARRLLGPDNASYMFDQDNLSDSQLDQPDSPEGRHTGGLWGKRHCGTDERENEGSAIQEKCYAPRFLQIPQDLTVEEGRFCRIDFKVGGLPTPDVCWYLDGKAIRPDDYHKMLVCEKGLHSFIIEIVTVHHAGVYECVARNRAGESSFTLRLDVIAQEALRPPTFVQKMSNFRAVEGDTVRLECKVDASPPPQLFWKKDKEMLRIDPARMSLYQDGSGRQCLLLERVSKSDAGWYTLSAINEAGMSTCNARLDISCRVVPPMKTAPPGSKALKLLSSLSHVPAVTSEPPSKHTAPPLYESEEL